jgi:hypothetical protein
MFAELSFTKKNLDQYLNALAKEFRRLNGTKMPAEIVLIGGAAVLINYGFRELTNDIDAIIRASSVMKEAINRVGDQYGLPTGWLNMDFSKTASYSGKLEEVSIYYKTFSNILKVRTVAAEYLVAMKLLSGRPYKYDLSDIVGILWEQQKRGVPIAREKIDDAVVKLYGNAKLPNESKALLAVVFESGDYEQIYKKTRESEITRRKSIIETGNEMPNAIKEESMAYIIKRAKEIKQRSQSDEN